MTIPPNRITVFPLKDELQWYDPDIIFQPFDDIFGRGVVNSGDLQVVQNGTPDGQILVKAGRGYVPYSGGGKRLFQTAVDIRSDAVEFLNPVPAWAGGNPRIHRIIARIKDATINPGDLIKGGVFDVLPGTATVGANLTNLSGAQSVPSDALLLGNLLQDGSTNVTADIDSTFGTVRARARIGAGASPTKGVRVNDAAVTDRGYTNLIAGSGITITANDDSANDEAEITIANTLTLNVVLLWDYTVAGAAKTTIDSYSDNSNTLLPTTYNHLLIRFHLQTDAAVDDEACYMSFNNDGGSNYDNNQFEVDGVGGLNLIDGALGEDHIYLCKAKGANQNLRFTEGEARIFNYPSTTKYRAGYITYFNPGTAVNATSLKFGQGGFLWHDSANALTRVAFRLPGSGHKFQIGSRIQIYGLV